MAHSKSFFGLRKGSTKSLTFSVYNGKQVTKDRVTEVKNPRTVSQMNQRMLMATILQAYSAGKVLFDHSIEGISYGQKTMNEFLRINLKKIRANADNNPQTYNFNAYGNAAVQANPLIISRGSLVPYNTADDLTISGRDITAKICAAGGATLGAIKAYLGLSAGDYFTVVAAISNTSKTGDFNGVTQINNGQIVFARCYVPTDDDSTPVNNDNFNTLFKIETSSGVTVSFTAPTSEAAGTVNVRAAASLDISCVAAGFIKSGKSNDSWKRSSQEFKMASGAIGLSKAAVLSSYPTGEDYILNGGESQVTPTAEQYLWLESQAEEPVMIVSVGKKNGYLVAIDNEDNEYYMYNNCQRSDEYGYYKASDPTTANNCYVQAAPADATQANTINIGVENVVNMNAAQVEEWAKFTTFFEAFGVQSWTWLY